LPNNTLTINTIVGGNGLSVVLIFGYYIMAFLSSSLGVKGILMPFADKSEFVILVAVCLVAKDATPS
jgi:hypothetical protein